MRYFVTGTDTDVGKTVACAWLMLHTATQYWKPVQAGLRPTDEATIRELTLLGDDRFVPTVHALTEPLSPHEAARRDGVSIEMEDFKLPVEPQPLLVEGAGGLMVPLNEREFVIDLIEYLALPVILVCRTTLGTINHSLLSLEALRRRGVSVAGAILCGPDVPHNRAAIESFGHVPILSHIPVLDPLNRVGLEAVYPESNLTELF